MQGIRFSSNELFAMRQNKRNGQPDEGVCDIEHTVHSDKLFVIRQHKGNGQPDQRVCARRTLILIKISVCDGNNERARLMEQDVC